MDKWILETTHSHTKFWNIFSVNFHVQNITRGKIFSLRLFQPLFCHCRLHLKASVLHKCGRVDLSVFVHFTIGSNSLTKPQVLRNQLKIIDFHEMWIFFWKPNMTILLTFGRCVRWLRGWGRRVHIMWRRVPRRVRTVMLYAATRWMRSCTHESTAVRGRWHHLSACREWRWREDSSVNPWARELLLRWLAEWLLVVVRYLLCWCLGHVR